MLLQITVCDQCKQIRVVMIKTIKPTNNARRLMTYLVTGTDKKKREKSLCFGMTNNSGRNVHGHITAQNRGGGSRKVYRLVDFSQISYASSPAEIVAIEYDPNRSANIALIQYQDGKKSYILAATGMEKGQSVICDENTPVQIGNRCQLVNIPPSTQIYNIELSPGRGGQIAKSAGGYAVLMGFDGEYAIIKLASSENRKIRSNCYASIGVVSNIDHNKVVVSKAGRFRATGNRPHVRGKAKNPCDHPHGGGEGNVSIGMVHPKTPWGMPALGHKTRNRKKASSNLIIRRRGK